MSFWFSDIDEYEDYDNGCSLLGTSDDLEYVKEQSEQYDRNCSLLSVKESLTMALSGVYKIFNDRWAGQTVWIISDTHFADEDLRVGMPNRPSDEELVRRINAKVGRKDTLIVLGDVGDIEFAKELRGYKVLVCGNHDAGATNYEEVFDEIYTGPIMIGEKLLLSHEPIEVPWAVNFHGHDHVGARRKGCYNFCADVIGYEPVNLNQFLKSGIYKDVESVHRLIIDKATARAKKRGKKLGR